MVNLLYLSGMRAGYPGSALVPQELIMLKKVSLLSENGFGGGGGQLAAEVGFVEHPEPDPRVAQGVETLTKTGPVADATDDEGGVIEGRREKGPGGLDGGMAGLHHLLRMGKIAPDENVDVRTVIYLPELHGKPPREKQGRKNQLRPAGFEPALTGF
jgi:hypothetical protein